jgi:methylated-DNA-protein-cysteine methyltransferase-like protein
MSTRTHPTYADVWAVVALIPRGRVATYGQIADLLGIPGHARFVGYALHALPPGSPVPWQRVVNARGRVSLRGESGSSQHTLLEREGVSVSRGVIDLRKRRWNPVGQGRPTRTRRTGTGDRHRAGRFRRQG